MAIKKRLFSLWSTGVERFELPSTVLETGALPLNYTPIWNSLCTLKTVYTLHPYIKLLLTLTCRLWLSVIDGQPSFWKFFFTSFRRTTFRLRFRLHSASPHLSSSSLQVKSPGQTLDRLVLVSSMHYCTSTPSLSTSSSSRGLTSLKEWDISSWGGLHA